MFFLIGEFQNSASKYDPRIGRWIISDPLTWGPDDARVFRTLTGKFIKPVVLEIGARNPQSFHRYNYVDNNPTNWIDPLGLTKKKDYETPWWNPWKPTGERRIVWEWAVRYTLPPEASRLLGVPPYNVEIHWQNRSHYEQWGRWIWDFSEYKRRWHYRWGEKTAITDVFGGGYMYNPYEAYPRESPEP